MPVGSDEAKAALIEAHAALEDIETRYRRERHGIERWQGPPSSKARLLKMLDQRRVLERTPVGAFIATISSR